MRKIVPHPAWVHCEIQQGRKRQLRRYRHAGDEIPFPISRYRNINRQGQRDIARLLAAPDKLTVQAAILEYVDLKELRPVCSSSRVFDTRSSNRRQTVQRARARSGASDRNLPVVMKQARHGRRRAEVRHVDALPKDRRREIDFADVDENPRHEFILVERLGILPHGPLVSGRAIDVMKHGSRHALFGTLAQTGDVVTTLK